MIIPNIWENEQCSKPPARLKRWIFPKHVPTSHRIHDLSAAPDVASAQGIPSCHAEGAMLRRRHSIRVERNVAVLRQRAPPYHNPYGESRDVSTRVQLVQLVHEKWDA